MSSTRTAAAWAIGILIALASACASDPPLRAKTAAEGDDDRAEAEDGKGASDDKGDGKGHPDEPAEGDLDAVVNQADAALTAKDFATAERLAGQVVSQSASGYPYAYVILGDVARSRHEDSRALTLYQKAMALDPDDGWSVEEAADVLTEVDRPKEARELLRRFVASHPQAEAEVYDALGAVEFDLGDVARAEAAFQTALRTSGDKDADAELGLARIAASKGDGDGTARALTAFFALEPERKAEVAKDPDFQKALRFPKVRALLQGDRPAPTAKPSPKPKKRAHPHPKR